MVNPIVVSISVIMAKCKNRERNHWLLHLSKKWVCCSSPTSSMYRKLTKISFLSVKTWRILAQFMGRELLTVGNRSQKNLVALVRMEEPVLLEWMLSVGICSVCCASSLVSVAPTGTAWNNIMRVFFISNLTHALKLQETLDLHLGCLALLNVDAFTNAKLLKCPEIWTGFFL